PAYTAGLNEREIIIEANGEKIESFDDFYKITVELKSGDLLNLKLSCEDGSVKAYKIYVKKMPLN
ncbi:MAG: hypothetical protein Q4P08_03875, partial [Eubacteriales bacterium]|nr:hypothetical protein [Eubacteriales bacterium]